MNKSILFILVLAATAMPCAIFAQQATTSTTVTTTESAGAISEFSPDSIVIRSETNSSPSHYSYTDKTTYVDETGATVSSETVKSGMPVTVYYTREGDRMIADKVVVRKTITTGNGGKEESRTRTTTTTETKY